jgi:hypothetical protein
VGGISYSDFNAIVGKDQSGVRAGELGVGHLDDLGDCRFSWSLLSGDCRGIQDARSLETERTVCGRCRPRF